MVISVQVGQPARPGAGDRLESVWPEDTKKQDNPTSGCMHVVYEDHELPTRLPGWSVTRTGTSAERLRLIEALRL
jgi:hypothetical protein